MKLITAYVPADKLDEVKAALKAAGVTGLSVLKAEGHGRREGETKFFRGAKYEADLVPRLRLEMVVTDRAAVERIVNALAAAVGGAAGAGKVWVTDVEWFVSLRTGEMNDDAI